MLVREGRQLLRGRPPPVQINGGEMGGSLIADRLGGAAPLAAGSDRTAAVELARGSRGAEPSLAGWPREELARQIIEGDYRCDNTRRIKHHFDQ